MDIWQLKRQLAFLAAAAVWADAPGSLVLTGGAVVSEDLEGNFAPGDFLPDGPAVKALPFGRVSCVGFELDDEVPARVDVARFELWVAAGGGTPFPGTTAVAAPGLDTHGINMETGALRAAAQPHGKSDGRSVDELLGRFLESLPSPWQFTPSVHGFQGRARAAGPAETVNGVQVLKRALELEVYDATVGRTYAPPRKVLGVGGVGTATVSWTLPPTRFDTNSIELWRGLNSGDPAPTTRAGHQVVLGSALATSGTENPGPGTWNYAAFAVYAEAGVADRASSGIPANSVVVT